MYTYLKSCYCQWISACLLALLSLSAGAKTEFFAEKSIKYQGLIYLEGQPATPGLVGDAQMKLTRSGSFSVKYNTGYGKISMKGKLNDEGYESKRVGGPLNNVGEAMITLDLDTLVITGTIEFDNDYPGRAGDKMVFELQPFADGDKRDPVPGAGEHVLTLTEGGGGEAPAQSSVEINIKPNGKVKMKGQMPDGSKLKVKTQVCENGLMPIYALWKKPHTVLIGWIAVDEVEGNLEWNYWHNPDGGPVQELVLGSVSVSQNNEP